MHCKQCMTKRKVFKNGELLKVLLDFHYETFDYNFDKIREIFNTEITPFMDANARWQIIEIAKEFWVDMYEYNDLITFGYCVMYQGVIYDIPSKVDMKRYIHEFRMQNMIKKLVKDD